MYYKNILKLFLTQSLFQAFN